MFPCFFFFFLFFFLFPPPLVPAGFTRHSLSPSILWSRRCQLPSGNSIVRERKKMRTNFGRKGGVGWLVCWLVQSGIGGECKARLSQSSFEDRCVRRLSKSRRGNFSLLSERRIKAKAMTIIPVFKIQMKKVDKYVINKYFSDVNGT